MQAGCWTSGELCLWTQYMVVRRSCSQRPPPSCVQANEPTCQGEWRDSAQGFRIILILIIFKYIFTELILCLKHREKKRKWRSCWAQRSGQCSHTPNLSHLPPKRIAGLPQRCFWRFVRRRENHGWVIIRQRNYQKTKGNLEGNTFAVLPSPFIWRWFMA